MVPTINHRNVLELIKILLGHQLYIPSFLSPTRMVKFDPHEPLLFQH